jgi:16S rRNA (adenine1518-N6/adenine1519-N6)-dimethyltransferase
VSDDGPIQSHKAASALRELGRGANRRFGQNFLTQPAFIERIADLAEISPGAPTLEIGPGLGVLTEALLRRGAALQVVEIDRELAARLQERLPELPLLVADATTLNWARSAPARAGRAARTSRTTSPRRSSPPCWTRAPGFAAMC